MKVETGYEHDMAEERINGSTMVFMGLRERRLMLAWLILSILAALLVYFGFRGYLSPELLFHFSNSLYC